MRMNTLSEHLGIHLQGAQASQNPSLRSILERDILPRWLPERRWFRSKSRTIASTAFESLLPLGSGDSVFGVVRVEFTDGGTEDYLLPLAFSTAQEAAEIPDAARLGPLPDKDDTRILIDGCWHPEVRKKLHELLFPRHPVTTEIMDKNNPIEVLRGHPTPSASLHGISGTDSRILSAEQSNSSIADAVFVKLYRKPEPGIHPEPEMLRFLREHTTFRNVPEFYSALEWTPAGSTPTTVALAQEFLPGGRNAWEYFLDQLTVRRWMVSESDDRSIDALSKEFLALVTRMGQRVGEMHAALGSRHEITGFAPEPLSAADIKATRIQTHTRLEESLGHVGEIRPEFEDPNVRLLHQVKHGADRLRALLLGNLPGGAGKKIRTHGDLHLGQILIEGDDIRILDFEGEPGRTLAEARVKYSPLRDVAGMLRSFHYAAHVAHKNSGGHSTEDQIPESQSTRLQASFLSGYFPAVAASGLLPESEADRKSLLDLFTLEKALYELHYEWNNRPDWAGIPLHGLVSLAGPVDSGTDLFQVSPL
jgi:maltose alpha-D-glucosyltransferase/alpha-amylase